MAAAFYNTAFVALATENLASMVTFYGALLEQQPQVFVPGVYAEFQLTGLKLGLFAPQSDHTTEFFTAHPGPFSLCLAVANLDTAIAHFATLNPAPTGSITTASHGREVYVYDPEGNRIILHEAKQN